MCRIHYQTLNYNFKALRYDDYSLGNIFFPPGSVLEFGGFGTPSQFQVTLQGSSQQVLHGIVCHSKSDRLFSFFIIYGLYSEMTRRFIWHFIREQASDMPSLFVGDFNMIFHHNKKLGDQPPRLPELIFNQEMASALEISDIKWRGTFYTQSNSQQGEERIWCKLDRVMANKNWTDSFPTAEVIFSNPNISDHAPAIIYFGENTRPRGSRFRFFNYWTAYEEMFKVERQSWTSSKFQGSPMYILVQKLKQVKFVLNKVGLSNEEGKICKAFIPQ